MKAASRSPAFAGSLHLGLLLVAGCKPPGAGIVTAHAAPPAVQYTLLDLTGGWRWIYRTEEAGTARVEDEQWRLRPDPAMPLHLVGRYVRTVEVRSLDRVPFQCNERPWYRQRAIYDVVAEVDGSAFVIHETGYQTEPSPCDHGFRRTADYQALPSGNRLKLQWETGPSMDNGGSSPPLGTQTLWQLDDDIAPLPQAAWPAKFDAAGPWRWDATSYDGDGNVRDEHEWWEITRRTPTRLDATYRRRVTVRSPDGSPIACAGAPSWTFDDAYVLDGQQQEEHWHFYELAVEPGDHPCLRSTPKRNLDEATAEQIGDFFVLEWRGKRRQILYRPDPSR